MVSDRQYRWALVSLAAFGSISAGILMGEQASADIEPFYANLATTMPRVHRADAIETVSVDGSKSWVETPDLNYRGPSDGDTMDSTY